MKYIFVKSPVSYANEMERILSSEECVHTILANQRICNGPHTQEIIYNSDIRLFQGGNLRK